MKCTICKSKVKKSGLSELSLNHDEMRRFLKVEKDESVCMDCKKDLLYSGIISPFFL